MPIHIARQSKISHRRNMRLLLLIVVVVFGVGTCAAIAMQSFGNASEDRVLSRRRRYLIFPDGSSLQLGMCKCELCKSINVQCSLKLRANL